MIGSRIQGSGFRVYGLGFRVQGWKNSVPSSIRVEGLALRV